MVSSSAVGTVMMRHFPTEVRAGTAQIPALFGWVSPVPRVEPNAHHAGCRNGSAGVRRGVVGATLVIVNALNCLILRRHSGSSSAPSRPQGLLDRFLGHGMLQKVIVHTVDYCTRYATQVIGIAALLGLVTGIFAAGHFAIDADVNKLISKELPWRQREVAFQKAFPPKEETILAVVDAPT